MTDSLVERLEAAPQGSRELSDEVLLAFGWKRGGEWGFWQAPDRTDFTADTRPDPTRSIDDALKWLVPEGWQWDVNVVPTDEGNEIGARVNFEAPAYADTPALALTIASLKAREVA